MQINKLFYVYALSIKAEWPNNFLLTLKQII